MSKVTIEMEWMDALYAKSILSASRRDDVKIMKLWESDGEAVPGWLFEEIDKLSRVIEIFEKAIHPD